MMIRHSYILFALVTLLLFLSPAALPPVLAKDDLQTADDYMHISREHCLDPNYVSFPPPNEINGVDTFTYDINIPGENNEVLPHLTSSETLDVSACVYLPDNYETGGPFPLLIFLHGQASSALASYGGYNYLVKQLADEDAQKYIILSINSNQINDLPNLFSSSTPGPDYQLIQKLLNIYSDDMGYHLARGRLVLKHLELWARWNAPPELDGRLPNNNSNVLQPSWFVDGKVDLTQVGVMGHSRGGEAMRAAYNYLTNGSGLAGDYVWPFFIGQPRIRGIFEIAPTDELEYLNADGVVWNVLLPMCDGDVVSLDGVKPFDRMLHDKTDNPPTQKSVYSVWGATHKQYNRAWVTGAEAETCGGVGNDRLDRSTQEETAELSLTEFFMANVGADRVASRNKLFNPLASLPTDIPTRIERGFTLSPNTAKTIILEDFDTENTPNTVGGPHVSYQAVAIEDSGDPAPEHDPIQHVGWVRWPETTSLPSDFKTSFQANWGGFNASSGYATLDLRLARTPSGNDSESTDFSLCLVYITNTGSETCSMSIPLSDYLDLRGPVGSGANTHSILQTVRIPLQHFCGADLSQLKGLRLKFDDTPSGSIYVANIGLSKEAGDGARIDEKACPVALDTIIVMDTTGSMGSSIQGLKNAMLSFVGALKNSGADYRVAVVDFKDKRYDSYASRLDLGFSTEQALISAAINNLFASGGGDIPEDVYSGLMTAIQQPWRDGAKKVIVLIGDAPPLDPEPGTGYTMNSVINAANAVDPANIYAVRVGSNASMRSAFQQLADGTGGLVFDTTASSANVSAALLNAVNAIVSFPSAVVGVLNDPILGAVGTPIRFEGGHSLDPNGFIARYEWDFNNDGIFDVNTSEPSISYTYQQAYTGWVVLRVTDNDGNRASVKVRATISAAAADTTPPVISIVSPLPQPYIHTDSLNIAWTATDTGSGLFSTTAALDGAPVTNGQAVDLFFFGLGSHTLTVSAVDKAGNSASLSVTFTVTANIDSLIAVEQRACALGWIDGPGVCNSLETKLRAARASIEKGKFDTARNQLNAFINELNAQNGKKVTQGYDVLKDDTLYVINHLP